MCTRVINDNLATELGVEAGTIEESWQVIDGKDLGGGAVRVLWKDDQKQADEKTPQRAPKNRVKNRYSPSGLIIYVSELKQKRSVKRMTMKRFGSGSTRWINDALHTFLVSH